MGSRRNVLAAAALFLALALVVPVKWWTAHAVAPALSDTTGTHDPTSEALRTVLAGSGPPLHRPADLAEVRESLSALYGHEPAPLWTRDQRLEARAGIAIDMLRQADLDGLVPEDYDSAWLLQQRDALAAGPEATPAALALFDTTLSAELLRFLGDVHRGRLLPDSPRRVDFAYHVDLWGGELGRRLRQAVDKDGLEAMLADLRPHYPQYAPLTRALTRYRTLECIGAVPPGRARQIELALERLRWLPHSVRGPFLVVNVPASRLVAFQSVADERPALQMSVVLGREARTETQLFVRLQTVIMRPFWYPSRSIIRNEVVPALARDPGYLSRERIDLVAATRDDSPALTFERDTLWQLRSGRLALRQRPGPHNALGLVKFAFPNDRVYMHDTPRTGLFAREGSDFSHGCIRVERPADLAAFVLARQPGWTAERIAAAMTGTQTMSVSVDPPVPVLIFYTTAMVRADETVEFFEDLYGLDARLERDLALPGLMTSGGGP